MIPSFLARPALQCAMVIVLGAPGMAADQPAPPADPAADVPKVEKTSAHGFKIGQIAFDTESRELRMPGVVNMQQGMIEFPIVHTKGRVHEAIFTTDALPLHFETAMRLLRYQPSKEVFPTHPGVDMNNPPPLDQWPDPVYPPANPESHVQVLVSWAVDGKMNEPVDIRTMLRRPGGNQGDNSKDANTPAIRFDTLAPHWVFTGSTEKMGLTVEDLGGCLVGIRTESQCPINTVAADPVLDSEWFADASRIPAAGTAVTIFIRPAKPTPAKPAAPSSATPPVPPNPEKP